MWKLLLSLSSENWNMFCFVARTSTALSKPQAHVCSFVNSAFYLLARKKKREKSLSCLRTPDFPVQLQAEDQILVKPCPSDVSSVDGMGIVVIFFLFCIAEEVEVPKPGMFSLFLQLTHYPLQNERRKELLSSFKCSTYKTTEEKMAR